MSAADTRAVECNARRRQRTLAPDCQRLVFRNVYARPVFVAPLDEVLFVKDDRRVTKAGDTSPGGAGVVVAGSVDAHVSQHDRRAVRDAYLVCSGVRADDNRVVADGRVFGYI